MRFEVVDFQEACALGVVSPDEAPYENYLVEYENEGATLISMSDDPNELPHWALECQAAWDKGYEAGAQSVMEQRD